MMEIRKIETKQEWDDAILQYDYTTMFLSWEWAEFEKELGHRFELKGIYDNENLVALLPIKYVNAKRGKYLHLRHAPLTHWDDENIINFIHASLIKISKENRLHFIRMSPLVKKQSIESAILRKRGYKDANINATDAELTVILDLTQTEEEILKNMRKTTRYSVRQAEKLGITVKYTDNLELFADFEKIYLETLARHKWHGYTPDYIKKEFEIFSKNNDAHMFVAYYQDQPIAASIFITHRDQVIYHHSGSTALSGNLPSSYLLHWEAIKHFKKAGYKIYNFWGVCRENEKNHPWYGLSLFKRGFTNQELEFIHPQDFIVSPWGHFTTTYELLETKLRGY
jgi:peptidoglycan pentaglycine glycine transferase (the first glycine)